MKRKYDQYASMDMAAARLAEVHLRHEGSRARFEPGSKHPEPCSWQGARAWHGQLGYRLGRDMGGRGECHRPNRRGKARSKRRAVVRGATPGNGFGRDGFTFGRGADRPDG